MSAAVLQPCGVTVKHKGKHGCVSWLKGNKEMEERKSGEGEGKGGGGSIYMCESSCMKMSILAHILPVGCLWSVIAARGGKDPLVVPHVRINNTHICTHSHKLLH